MGCLDRDLSSEPQRARFCFQEMNCSTERKQYLILLALHREVPMAFSAAAHDTQVSGCRRWNGRRVFALLTFLTINTLGSELAPERRHTNTTAKTRVTHSSSHLACKWTQGIQTPPEVHHLKCCSIPQLKALRVHLMCWVGRQPVEPVPWTPRQSVVHVWA